MDANAAANTAPANSPAATTGAAAGNAEIEIGAWWEITEPHVKAAGIPWRGRYPWDWHANVGFATGYTPAEREILADIYMAKFKEIFGRYPASVGSWFIDAHTLDYMHRKYGVIASCNCKDQIGTDGYTLWGGYWNQAYYPSRRNAYMPAQTAAAQIPVPIFRMLGSDPIYQYDTGLGARPQNVISLEPVYGERGPRYGGGSKPWVDWFFKNMFTAPALGFNYAQAGQENSFTWRKMRAGLEYQIPILETLHRAGKIRVETLEQSARWFRKKYPLTPATAFSVLDDYRPNSDKKTLWFNSRFYRANLLWDGPRFRVRDIHLFDETLASDYVDRADRRSTQCVFDTLPLVDGNVWSSPSHHDRRTKTKTNANVLAGLRLVNKTTGAEILLAAPEIFRRAGDAEDTIHVRCNIITGSAAANPATGAATDAGVPHVVLTFTNTTIAVVAKDYNEPWALELTADAHARLPFVANTASTLAAVHRDHPYRTHLTAGTFERLGDTAAAPNATVTDADGTTAATPDTRRSLRRVWRIIPNQDGTILLGLNTKEKFTLQNSEDAK